MLLSRLIQKLACIASAVMVLASVIPLEIVEELVDRDAIELTESHEAESHESEEGEEKESEEDKLFSHSFRHPLPNSVSSWELPPNDPSLESLPKIIHSPPPEFLRAS